MYLCFLATESLLLKDNLKTDVITGYVILPFTKIQVFTNSVEIPGIFLTHSGR